MNYSVVVPTLNGGARWQRAARSIARQNPPPTNVLVIDSGSTDDTVRTSVEAGFGVHHINKSDFDHGGTRQLGVELLEESEFIVFLTQDAVPLQQNSLAVLVSAFSDSNVGAAYGRQVATEEASVFERHARELNYPQQSRLKALDQIAEMGIRTAFFSDSFAAYRRESLRNIGGFPNPSLFAEDMHVAARLILGGHAVKYQADAVCEHWHEYGVMDEFRRAFDIGAFHSKEKWILEAFGTAKGEGSSLIIGGLKRVGREKPSQLPLAFLKYGAKTTGYLAGRLEKQLPVSLKRKLSLNPAYWNHPC